jgi:hypothetical protein
MKLQKSLWGVLYLSVFLILCGLANASEVYSEIEISKSIFCTAEQGEQIKRLMPRYSDWLNSYIVAIKSGMTAAYQVSVWVDRADDPILSAYVVKPDTSTVSLMKDGPDSFDSVPDGPREFYTSLADLEAHWPSGDYILHVVFTDGHEQTWTTTIPDYNTTPFPETVSGSLSTDASGQVSLEWSTVEDVSEYEAWAFELKTMKDVYDSGNLYIDHPSSQTELLSGAYEGKGDYNFGVNAERDVTSAGPFNVEFQSLANWFMFKTPCVPIVNEIQKCNVKAGKTESTDSIQFSGLLDAIEADFLLAMGGDVVVTIDSKSMVTPLGSTFPIDEVSFKKGKYNYARKENASQSCFKFDAKNGKMTFSAKNVDLTGLACPMIVTVTIGAYSAEIELDETIVNGSKKPCPPELMMGVVDSITVDKTSVKFGKTTGTDAFTVTGTFTLAGDMNKEQSLVVTLGDQVFTVQGDELMSRGTSESCNKAFCSEGGILKAKLDFAKCTYTLTVSNIAIDQYGVVPFGIDVCGNELGGLGVPGAEVDLGPKQLYEYENELRYYNALSSGWNYTSGCSIDVGPSMTNVNGSSCSYTTCYGPYVYQRSYWHTDEAGTYLKRWMVESDMVDLDIDVNLQTAPFLIKSGLTHSATSSFSGSLDIVVPNEPTLEVDISYLTGTVTASLKVGKWQSVTVQGETFSALQMDHTYTIKGTMDIELYDNYWGDYLYTTGTLTMTVKDKCWYVPDIGIVKMSESVSAKVTARGAGSASERINGSYELIDYN